MKKHNYSTSLEWAGNQGNDTNDYRSYKRDFTIQVDNKEHSILGSSDPSFLGDPARYNPEELFLSSISSCHMLWFLHLCSQHGVHVVEYRDEATGVMEEDKTGSGRFVDVTLQPHVIVRDASMVEIANQLHLKANQMCFIANSCNFKINHEAQAVVAQ